jgi:hypothetical protein
LSQPERRRKHRAYGKYIGLIVGGTKVVDYLRKELFVQVSRQSAGKENFTATLARSSQNPELRLWQCKFLGINDQDARYFLIDLTVHRNS